MYTLSTRNMLVWVVALLMVLSLGFGRRVDVKENYGAELRCKGQCYGDVKWEGKCSKWMKKVLPRKCQQEICDGDAFMNRSKINQRGSSLLLNPAVYTNTGRYRCYCNGSVLCQVRLHVRIEHIFRVNAGENVTLPCHVCPAECTAEHNITIQWKKYSWGRGETDASRYESGFSFLNIPNITASDEGRYCCYCGKTMWCYTVLLEGCFWLHLNPEGEI